MSNKNGGLSCTLGCWILAGGLGLLLAILLLVMGDFGWMAALFLGAVAFVLLGLFLNWLLCGKTVSSELTGQGAAATRTGAGPAADTAATPAPARAQPAAAAPDPVDERQPAAEPAAASQSPEAAEPAAEDPAPAQDPEPAAAPTQAAPEDAASPIKPSAPLAGQDELASRKGTWKYEGGASAEASVPAGASSPAPAPATGGPDDGGGIDRDGDGVVEGPSEGHRPAALSAPRDGRPDDLKRIKGIGPKLEKVCNSLGFYHFDQIAAWTEEEVAWVDANLEGFRGRVTRDRWVEQAKLLASGGETEFSKKVDKGGVYE